MFRPSANVVTLVARPVAGSISSTFDGVAAGLPFSGLAGQGYSIVLVTQRRPLASNAMLIGLLMSGSEATSWISEARREAEGLSVPARG